MIEVTVQFGNHNKYRIELPPTTKIGVLSWYLTKIINYEPSDVLYLIMGGSIIGSQTLPFNRSLADCNIINNRCVVSMVLRDNTIQYPDADLYISTRNNNWVQKYGDRATTTAIEDAPIPITAFIQSMGFDPNALTDVQVSLTQDAYEQYITRHPGSVEDTCSICHNEILTEAASLSCGHTFHDNCIREWLTTTSVRCPICNHDVRTE